MILPVEMYIAECDICGAHYEHGDYSCLSDKDSVREDASEGGWYFTDYNKGKCYCENCHSFDEIDNLVLKAIT